MTKYIYLCGPIRGLTVEQATKWRIYFEDRLFSKVVCLDPTRDHEFVVDAAGKIIGPQNSPMATHPALVGRDLADVRRSSLLVANFVNSTANIGSLIEIGYAHALNIPIVLILDPQDTPLRNHPFIADIPIATFGSYEEAAVFIGKFLGD